MPLGGGVSDGRACGTEMKLSLPTVWVLSSAFQLAPRDREGDYGPYERTASHTFLFRLR